MKSYHILSLCMLLILNACNKSQDNNEPDINNDNLLSGLTLDNFPILDGSDSTEPLRCILICKLLDYHYEWLRKPVIHYDGMRYVNVKYPTQDHNLYQKKILNSNTHKAFVNLIDGKADIIITARGISRDEIKYANEKNQTIIQKPIALDALAFIVNKENEVTNLSHQNIKDIYLKRVANWSHFGWVNERITPYIRNANSGSQEKFETLVMNGEELENLQILNLEKGYLMFSPYEQLFADKYGIAFTPYYFYKVIVDWAEIKDIGINGVKITKESIINRTYPFVTEIMVAINEKSSKDSWEYKIFDFITSKEGKEIIKESGYFIGS